MTTRPDSPPRTDSVRPLEATEINSTRTLVGPPPRSGSDSPDSSGSVWPDLDNHRSSIHIQLYD